MSQSTQFRAELGRAIARCGGAHLTKQAMQRTADRFAQVMRDCGFTHLRSVNDIGGKQIRRFVEARANVVRVRTLQNQLSHVRCWLREMGCGAIADAPELSNEALNVSGGSRKGQKEAITQEQYNFVLERADELDRPEMAALLRLEIEVGLRGNEALHARSDTLARWEKELLENSYIDVIEGSKGGRPRRVTIQEQENALQAVRQARAIADRQGGFLIVRADGAPSGGLKQARNIYHSWMKRAGITPHAARYTWAQRTFAILRKRGYSDREALSVVTQGLGHGSGRGRWARSAYAVKPLLDEDVEAALGKLVW